MNWLRRHLTYANVTATLALVIAVAGGTTAIAMKATAPKNSVTTKSIRPYNVTARDLTRLIEVQRSDDFNDPGAARWDLQRGRQRLHRALPALA